MNETENSWRTIPGAVDDKPIPERGGTGESDKPQDIRDEIAGRSNDEGGSGTLWARLRTQVPSYRRSLFRR
jgi:hypothetical protein